MSKLDDFTEQTKREQTTIKEEMEQTLQTVRDAAAKAGVGQQSIVFGEQATSDGDDASLWLKAGAAVGPVTVIYLVATLLVWPPDADTNADVVRGLGTRILVLTLLAYALGFSLRQYASTKHNQTVNLHRQNALRTFETFVKATDDQETKDAVLLEATRSIFASQPSGFLRGGREAESPSTVIEVIRRISGSPAADRPAP